MIGFNISILTPPLRVFKIPPTRTQTGYKLPSLDTAVIYNYIKIEAIASIYFFADINNEYVL